jgi:hypothetical protein
MAKDNGQRNAKPVMGQVAGIVGSAMVEVTFTVLAMTAALHATIVAATGLAYAVAEGKNEERSSLFDTHGRQIYGMHQRGR